MSEENLRIALVGLGKMGLVHAGILNVLPNVRLVALCEKSSLVRRFSKKAFKELEIVDDLKKFADLRLDAVYVTTPIPSHFSVANAILEDKISSNLFVEKTLSQTYKQSKQLADLAQSRRSVTMVGYLRRFYVTFNKARELLQKGTIGGIESFKAHAYSSDFHGLNEEPEAKASRGGVLRDLGCHAIDLALWFFGDLRVVAEPKLYGHTKDSVSFELENSELAGELDVSWCKEDYRMPEVSFSIAGSKGKLLVNDDQVKLELTKSNSNKWYRHDLDDNVPFYLGLPEYYREDLHYVKSLAGEMKPEPDFGSAAKVDKIIEDVTGREAQNE